MATLVHPSLTNCQALAVSPRFAALPEPGLFPRAASTLRLWHRRLRERRELALLGPRDLHDIGVSSSDVWQEIKQPFWRSALRG
jgi:uncharacterized protein YjiS (DUF1127 family)